MSSSILVRVRTICVRTMLRSDPVSVEDASGHPRLFGPRLTVGHVVSEMLLEVPSPTNEDLCEPPQAESTLRTGEPRHFGIGTVMIERGRGIKGRGHPFLYPLPIPLSIPAFQLDSYPQVIHRSPSYPQGAIRLFSLDISPSLPSYSPPIHSEILFLSLFFSELRNQSGLRSPIVCRG